MINPTGLAALPKDVEISTQEKKAPGQDDKAVGSKSQTGSDKPLSHRSVVTTRKRPANFTDDPQQPIKIPKRILKAEVLPDKYEQLQPEFTTLLTVGMTGQQRDDKAVKPESLTNSGKPVHHKTVSFPAAPPEFQECENLRQLMEPLPRKKSAFHQMQPFKADEITIDSPEFKQPPGKIKKLSLAIKIFSKSFMRTSDFNNPETDRSARVETIRNRVSTVTAGLFDILTGAIILKGFIAHLGSRESFGASENFLGLVITYLIATIVIFGAFGIGWLLSQGITRLVTSTVAASVDTREKLAEMTAFTSPEARFLKKHQRMEASLCALQTRLIDAKLARTLENCDRGNAEIKAKDRARKEIARLNPGAEKETWFESIQREHLRDWYEFYASKIEELEQDIRKTKDWLDRAAKQKERLTNEPRELEELYAEVAPPIDGVAAGTV